MMLHYRSILRNIFWESIELLVGLSTLISGLLILVDAKAYQPQVIQLLPSAIATWWAWSLVLGGFLNTWGILVSNIYTRRGGLILLGGSCVTLAVVIVFALDKSRTVGFFTYFLAGTMLIMRYIALKRVDKALTLMVRLEKMR